MANDSWATPAEIYRAMDLEFNFCADIAASNENAKHSVFWTENDTPNPLDIDWHYLIDEFQISNPWLWCNPPYSDISPWVTGAIRAQQKGIGTVMLVMADPSVKWFAEAAAHATEIRFVTEGRIAFLENGKPKSGNNKGSVFFIFAPRLIGLSKVSFVTRFEIMNKGMAGD